MIGIYQDDRLVETYTSEEKASEFLPKILFELLKKYDFSDLIYANGPGSYMGIKISYVTLKTLSIVKNIPLLAVNAFELNGYGPISANKNFCFVYKESEIVLEQNTPAEFFLPESLKDLKLNNDNLPFYFLDAI